VSCETGVIRTFAICTQDTGLYIITPSLNCTVLCTVPYYCRMLLHTVHCTVYSTVDCGPKFLKQYCTFSTGINYRINTQHQHLLPASLPQLAAISPLVIPVVAWIALISSSLFVHHGPANAVRSQREDPVVFFRFERLGLVCA
jgi:hypothetical protein